MGQERKACSRRDENLRDPVLALWPHRPRSRTRRVGSRRWHPQLAPRRRQHLPSHSPPARAASVQCRRTRIHSLGSRPPGRTLFRALPIHDRSEEHTSELSHSQISYAVFCLKKKKKKKTSNKS